MEPAVTQEMAKTINSLKSAKSAKSGACSGPEGSPGDTKPCPEHQRSYEAFCLQCKV